MRSSPIKVFNLITWLRALISPIVAVQNTYISPLTLTFDYSAEISGEGTYFILDLDEFLKSIGIAVFRNVTEPSLLAEPFTLSDTDVQANAVEPETITLYDNNGVPTGEIPNPKYTPESPVLFASIDDAEQQIKTESDSSYAVNGETMGKADFVFVIDKIGSMGSAITN